ncbi:large ribosomal subunit protein uL1m [Aulostomus maculatus]
MFPHGLAVFPNMATWTRTAWKVFAGCRRQLLPPGSPIFARVPWTPSMNPPVRTLAAPKLQKRDKKTPDVKDEKKKRVIDDKHRHKPFGKTAWRPVDDVYIMKHYPRTIYSAADAIDLLMKYQVLDFTPPDQPLYIDLKLNMMLEKKKKIDPFISTLLLPHCVKTEMNKILVFTEDAHQAQVARKLGAAFVGGQELVQQILDDHISADFYLAVPDIMQKISPLKNKLRKNFPKGRRGNIGMDIPKMMKLFAMGHQYQVEDKCYVRTQIARLDFPKEHIITNLKAVLRDVCSFWSPDKGDFIERAIINSQTSEALWFNSQELLVEPAEEKTDSPVSDC